MPPRNNREQFCQLIDGYIGRSLNEAIIETGYTLTSLRTLTNRYRKDIHIIDGIFSIISPTIYQESRPLTPRKFSPGIKVVSLPSHLYEEVIRNSKRNTKRH